MTGKGVKIQSISDDQKGCEDGWCDFSIESVKQGGVSHVYM